MKKTLIAVCLVSLNLLAYGCSKDSCVDMCEQLDECADKDSDCEASCKEARSDAQTAGCTDAQNKLYDCAAEIDDICDEGLLPSCTNQATTYLSCFETFCGNNPDSAVCTTSAQ
jgi:hypothetical protein